MGVLIKICFSSKVHLGAQPQPDSCKPLLASPFVKDIKQWQSSFGEFINLTHPLIHQLIGVNATKGGAIALIGLICKHTILDQNRSTENWIWNVQWDMCYFRFSYRGLCANGLTRKCIQSIEVVKLNHQHHSQMKTFWRKFQTIKLFK